MEGNDVYKTITVAAEGEYLPGRFDENDPIDVLDVTVSSRLILDELLGIKDLRRDKRIDFVGGLRGLDELKDVATAAR